MSYQNAYTTRFSSLDGTLWEVGISFDYGGLPLEISLEGDEPCVIEWQETGKLDVVQSATCTLRVSVEHDRQMLQLMDRRLKPLCIVMRDGKEYWRGTLDDAVYEEPYSFKKAYVTELTFSDFGILNRMPFTLRGRQSVKAIVDHCLEGSFLDYLGQELLTQLAVPKTLQPVTLGMLWLNADRFAPDNPGDDPPTKRKVLEETLRPLGLRIVQKNGTLRIYDIDYLRAHADTMANYPVWKGTDAVLRGSETFGRFEVAFKPDAKETLADGEVDYDSIESYDPFVETNDIIPYLEEDEPYANLDIGAYIRLWPRFPPEAPLPYTRGVNAYIFQTKPLFSDCSDVGLAWKATCLRDVPHGWRVTSLISRDTATGVPATMPVLTLWGGFMPVVPDADEFQLRVNLDFVLSFRMNPFEQNKRWHVGSEEWERALRFIGSGGVFAVMVPVKLELVNDYGAVTHHYVNGSVNNPASPYADVHPLGIGNGHWATGPSTFGDMFLSYYKNYDAANEDRFPLLTAGGWSTNRITLAAAGDITGTFYRLRPDGEYLPLPPAAGRLRLTVGSGAFTYPFLPGWANTLYTAYRSLAWQLYRNPKITLVKAWSRDDGIGTGTVYERRNLYPDIDCISDTFEAGTWRKGIAPSARGLFFNADGIVWEKFVKGGITATLEKHRLHFLTTQTRNAQPVIAGTAELAAGFCAYREWSTPGTFVVTALRQDLHQGTEYLTMACINHGGSFDYMPYDFAWGNPLCAEELPYRFAWSGPLCAMEPGPYRFAWGDPLCTMQYEYTLEWEAMASHPVID